MCNFTLNMLPHSTHVDLLSLRHYGYRFRRSWARSKIEAPVRGSGWFRGIHSKEKRRIKYSYKPDYQGKCMCCCILSPVFTRLLRIRKHISHVYHAYIWIMNVHSLPLQKRFEDFIHKLNMELDMKRSQVTDVKAKMKQWSWYPSHILHKVLDVAITNLRKYIFLGLIHTSHLNIFLTLSHIDFKVSEYAPLVFDDHVRFALFFETLSVILCFPNSALLPLPKSYFTSSYCACNL